MSQQHNVEDIYTLSPGQQGMLLYLLLKGYNSEVYFDQYVASIAGKLDLTAWRAAWQLVVDRHAALRTLFVWERREQPLQVVRRQVELPWQELDWSSLPEPEREERLAAFRRADHEQGFDLNKAPLLRVTVVRWSAEVYKLVWSFSHLVVDGWSMAVVLAEVLAAYRALARGEAPSLGPAPPFRAYIDWLQRQDVARAESFWRRTLAGFTAPTPLGFDGTGAGGEITGWAAAEVSAALPAAATRALHELARGHRVTLNTVLQGAWGLLLGRLAGSDDVVFGAVVSGRPPEIPGIESMVGLLINGLPVRVGIDGAAGVGPWLRELQERQIEQREYEYCPPEQIHAWSELGRETPPFESLLVFENYPVDGLGGPAAGDAGFEVRDAAINEANNYPLSLFVSPRHEALEIRLAYHWTRFSEAAARQILGCLTVLLGGLAARPEGRLDELPLLTAEESAELLAAGTNASTAAGDSAGIHHLVAAAAARTPGAVAVEQGETRLTYADLLSRAELLAHHLRRLGVREAGTEAVVGLAVERSPEMLVGMLGVLAAGGAYLPLDPAYPRERLAFMLADAGVRVLLTQERLAERLPTAGLQVVRLDADWPRIAARSGLAGGPGGGPAGGPGDALLGGLPTALADAPAAALPAALRAASPTVLATPAALPSVTPPALPSAASSALSPAAPSALPPALPPAVLPASPAYVIYTSGSTGRPKGVVVPHAALVNYVRAAVADYGFAPGDRVLQFASISFDTSAEEIYPCLAASGTLVLRDDAMLGSLEGFVRALGRLRITALDLPTAYWHELVAELETQELALPETLRLLIIGGEEALAARLAVWRRRVGERVRLVNTYGPTEATIVSTSHDLTAPAEQEAPAVVAIGRAVPAARALVLGRQLELLPAGIDGELYVGGAGLARGYLGRPELTAERFVPDPFAPHDGGEPGARLYRTGDLARLLPDGALLFRGRADQQVKIRGFRIEPGEIAEALRAHPAVRECVVVARGATDKRLVAYLAPAAAAVPARELRAMLAERLPDYMVPADYVWLDRLPMTATGKLDRLALPAPEAADAAEAVGPAPRTQLEELLAGIWQKLLGIDRPIGAHDNFFGLGGHSLLATRVLSRLREALGVEVPLRALFEAPTVAGLAAAAAARLGEPRSAAPPLAAAPRGERREEDLPLSFTQQRLWILDQLEPDGFAYNITAAVRMHGRLVSAALGRAIAEIVRRHEALRTVFPQREGNPWQQVLPAVAVRPLPLVDLGALPAAVGLAEARRLAGADARRPFDLAGGPLLRTTLLHLAPEEHALLLAMHHIVSDYWSLGIFTRELTELYRFFAAVPADTAHAAHASEDADDDAGTGAAHAAHASGGADDAAGAGAAHASHASEGAGAASPLPELPLQFTDFALWQRGWLQGEVLAEQLRYWQRSLAGAPPKLELPADRPRPAEQSHRGGRRWISLPQEPARQVAAASRRLDVTPFMLLLAAFAALLGRYSGEEELVIGTPIANRGRRELEELIGFFANTLALRIGAGGDPSFAELARRVRQVALGAYAHQDLPFELLVDALAPERDLGYTPIFQVMFVLQNAPPPELELGDLTFSSLGVEGGKAAFDLNLAAVETAGELVVSLEYASDLFDAATAERLLGHFGVLLSAALAQPETRLSALPLLTAAERHQLLAGWNDTGAELPAEPTVSELIAASARRAPAAVAVSCGGRELSYGELVFRAGRLARRLVQLGVGPEVRVGLCLERDEELVVAMLAVLEAGGAYVPLDPTHPAERLGWILEDAGAPVLIADRAARAALAAVPQQSAAIVDPTELAALPRQAAAIVDAAELAAGTDAAAQLPRRSNGSHGSNAGHGSQGSKAANGFHRSHGSRAAALSNRASEPAPPPRRAGPENLAYVIYTSGSTGRPKGVEVRHRGVVNYLASMARRPGLGPRDTVLALTTVSFDIAVTELLLPLVVGARIELADRETAADAERLAALLDSAGVTVMQATPATWTLLLEGGWSGRPGLTALAGGEALPAALAERLLARVGTLWNVYGPTETTVWSTLHPLRAGDGRVSIGRPLANTTVHLLGASGEPVPVGVAAELCIGGSGLARGYLGRPDLTAERFVPDPFGPPGGRLYRTGDLARRLAGGELECLGRIDHQVKVRGFRIELGEIEAALAALPGVAQAAVVVRERQGGERFLAAFVVAAPGAAPEAGSEAGSETAPAAGDLRAALQQQLRAALQQKLPDYMVPAAFVTLAALPLSPSGKVDRRALASLPLASAERARAERRERVAPRNPAEALLAAIWAELLEQDEVGTEDNFFALGGDSILAVRAVAKARQAGLLFSPRDLFKHQTVAALAAAVAARAAAAPRPAPFATAPTPATTGTVPGSLARAAGSPATAPGLHAAGVPAEAPSAAALVSASQDSWPATSPAAHERAADAVLAVFPPAADPAEVEARLAELGLAGAGATSPHDVEAVYTLSPGQHGMLLYLLLKGYTSEVYFEQYVTSIAGNLDLAAWRAAWQLVVDRHAALRTLFVWERREQPLQVVRRQVELPWQELDWSGLPEPEREERLAAFQRADHAQGFDLDQAPLLRVAVVRWSAELYKVVWSFSHLVIDGWSIGLILSEVLGAYPALARGEAPPLAPAPPFSAYIDWLQRQDAASAESFWRRTLAGFTAPTPLGFDGTGTGGEVAGWAAAEVSMVLPADATRALHELARGHRVTLNTVLQGAWGLLLGRLAGSDDVVFGAVVSGRPPEVPGIESMVGLLINGLPVRVGIDGAAGVGPWLRQLQERQIELREYGYSPPEQIHAWSELDHETPLFESLLVFENYPLEDLRGAAAGEASFKVRDAAITEANNQPLSLFVTPYHQAIELKIAYHWTRFSAAAARRILGCLTVLLDGLAARPEGRLDEVPLLTAEESAELLAAGTNASTVAEGAELLAARAGASTGGRDRDTRGARDGGEIGAAGSGSASGSEGIHDLAATAGAAACIHDLVAAAAARTPLAVAVEQGETRLTYADLLARAEHLAHHLRRLGVGEAGTEAVVGLAVERSPEMLVGMLGVLAAGGAYLPLDPAYPRERLAFMLADAGVRMLLTQERLAERLPTAGLEVVRLDADWPRIAVRSGLAGGPGGGPAGGPGDALLGGLPTALADAPAAALPAALRAASPTVLATPAALPSVTPPALPSAASSALSPAAPSALPPALPPAVLPASPAYVIYTSGSTGRPKGVVVPHASLVNYVRAAVADYGFAPGDRVLQFASISFDTSAEEIYPCLAAGGTLVLRDDAMLGSLEGFVRALGRLRITALDLPTAYWHELVAELEAQELALPETLRLLIIGGEEALAARLAVWRRRVGERVRLVNTYGPTEATIVSTSHDLTAPAEQEAPAVVAIGRAVPAARALVLGRQLELLPAGIDGELYVGGAGLARGYLGRPELTAERFVPDPFAPHDGGEPGARLYRTGDLARLLPDGILLFRGRADQQVKIRGFRIEPGEIAAALRRQPTVRDAVVALHGDAGRQRLVAWVVPADLAALPAASPASPATAGAAVPRATREASPPAHIGSPPVPIVPANFSADLRAALEASLPAHMIPAAFVFLDGLPLTPSGKVDRRALPAPDPSRGGLAEGHRAPRNPAQEVLAGLWCELLGIESVGIDEDFFKLGGHSLLVARLVARVRQAFGVELSLVEVFKQPTVEALAGAIERAERGIGGVGVGVGGGAGAALPQLPPIGRVPRDQPIPLSFPQERVWFLDQLTPGGNIAYNFQVTLWLSGPLDAAVLRATLGELVRRHEILRTSFPAAGGQPVQVIHPPGPVEVPFVDLRGLPEEIRHEVSERIFEATARVPFDIARAPLIRWRLLRLADDLWELIQVEHHFVHDGWSFGVLLQEIKAIYPALLRGEPSPLPEPPVQYADFAVWQRRWMAGPVLDQMLGYWQAQLAGAPPGLEIATDRPRPARGSFAGDLELVLIPPELYMALRRFSRREGFTLYMTMLAAFFTLLGRYTGERDLVIGTSNANRRARALEGMIGMFVNTLLLRGDLGGNPAFRQLLGRVRELTLDVYAHQDMPFERLVQQLRPERQLGRNPLFQIMFNFHDAGVPDLEFGGLEVKFLVRGNRSAKMDMNVIVVPRAEQRVGLAERDVDRQAVLHWEYSTDLFDRSTVLRMIEHYLTLLGGVVEDAGRPLSELPLLTPAERRELLADWRAAEAVPVAGSLHQLFSARAAQDPAAIAVSLGERRLTYGELERRANRLAHRLRALGVVPQTPVPLCADRSLDLVVGILGILKAGGGYVPVDPSYPPERKSWILEDSQAGVASPVVVTEERLAGEMAGAGRRAVCLDDPTLDAESDTPPADLAAADHLAYVIYTSGSTGRPKGVPIRHADVVRLFAATAPRFGFGSEDVWTLFHSISFDFSVWEMWGALLHGGRLVVVPYLTSRSPEALFQELVRERVTVLNQTPSAFRQLIEAEEAIARHNGGGPGLALRWVIFGGEALDPGSLRPWFARHGDARPRLVNGYGITETTVFVTFRPVTWADAEAVGQGSRIGRPIPDQAVRLLDLEGNLVPMGVPGEIHVGGAGLAAGYFNRPELTAERFVPDPFAGEAGDAGAAAGARLYRSGDLARVRPGGDLEYLGRIDHQVKVRGFRIELGEIEAALDRHPAVREAVVLARGDGAAAGESVRLVAYVAAAPEAAPSPEELRRFLKSSLPEYMVPAAFVVLAALPLTAHGKVDRRALPAPEAAGSGRETELVPPRSPIEEALAAIWREVLGVARLGVRDDFFLLGGHSLSAVRIQMRVREALGADLSLAVIFENPTIETLAAALPAAPLAIPEPPLPEDGRDGETAALLERAAALSDAELDALVGQMMTEEEPA